MKKKRQNVCDIAEKEETQDFQTVTFPTCRKQHSWNERLVVEIGLSFESPWGVMRRNARWFIQHYIREMFWNARSRIL